MEMASAQLASIDPELAQVFQYEAAEILEHAGVVRVFEPLEERRVAVKQRRDRADG